MDSSSVDIYIVSTILNTQKVWTDSTSTKIYGLHFLRNWLIYMDSHIPALTESTSVGAISQSQSSLSLTCYAAPALASWWGREVQPEYPVLANPVHRVTPVFHRVTENWLNVFYARIKFSLVTDSTRLPLPHSGRSAPATGGGSSRPLVTAELTFLWRPSPLSILSRVCSLCLCVGGYFNPPWGPKCPVQGSMGSGAHCTVLLYCVMHITDSNMWVLNLSVVRAEELGRAQHLDTSSHVTLWPMSVVCTTLGRGLATSCAGPFFVSQDRSRLSLGSSQGQDHGAVSDSNVWNYCFKLH